MHLPIGHKQSIDVDKSLKEANKRQRSAKNGHPDSISQKENRSFMIPPCVSISTMRFQEGKAGRRGTPRRRFRRKQIAARLTYKVTSRSQCSAQGAGPAGAGACRRPRSYPRFFQVLRRSFFKILPSCTGHAVLEVHLGRRFERVCVGMQSGAIRFLNTRGRLVSILAFHRINYCRGLFGESPIGAAWPQAKRRRHRLRDKSGGDLAAGRFGGNRPVRRRLPVGYPRLGAAVQLP